MRCKVRYAGRDVTHRFADVRSAVAYALSVRRGPQARRPSYGNVRVKGDRDAGSMVAAAIIGDCGVAPGSAEWKALEAWALANGPQPTWVRHKLRPVLGMAGLLDDQRESDVVTLDLEDVTWIEEDGTEYKTVREVR